MIKVKISKVEMAALDIEENVVISMSFVNKIFQNFSQTFSDFSRLFQ